MKQVQVQKSATATRKGGLAGQRSNGKVYDVAAMRAAHKAGKTQEAGK